MDYTRMTGARVARRGQAEALSDAKAQSVIRLVTEQYEANRVTTSERQLARDIVHNYEGDDASILQLQAAHAKDRNWLPQKAVTRSVLNTVGATYESASA